MRLQVKWVNGWAQLSGTGPDGQRIRRALKTRDPKQAEQARAQIESRLWQSNLYGKSEVITFDECALAYIEDGGDKRFIMAVARHFQGWRLKDITPKDIRDAAKSIYPAAGPATWNRQGITPARAVINFGHQQGWCAPIRVRHFPAEKPTRRAVDRKYIDRLIGECNPHLAAIVLFINQTGRRIGDVMRIEPRHVDLRNLTITIPKTKNGDPFTAHITAELAARLSDLPARGGKVFGYNSRSAVRNALKRAAARAGVEYLGTHQIGRHSFATSLSNAGWGTKEIAEAGGWKSTRIVAETYDHPDDPARRAAMIFGKKMPRK